MVFFSGFARNTNQVPKKRDFSRGFPLQNVGCVCVGGGGGGGGGGYQKFLYIPYPNTTFHSLGEFGAKCWILLYYSDSIFAQKLGQYAIASHCATMRIIIARCEDI